MQLPGSFALPRTLKQSSGLSDGLVVIATRWLPAMTGLDNEFSPRNAPISFEITLAGGIHHARRQGWRRRIAVPAAGAALGVEIVAQRLLVETRLRLAGLVGVRRPEPGAIRRHHLIDQDDAPVLVASELEFGIGDDDTLIAGKLLAEPVDRARHALQRIGDLIADDLAHPRNRDVLVMPVLGLGGGTEDRRLKLGAFDEAGRKLLSRKRPLLRIFLPCRAREVAADHAFDRENGGAMAQHRSPQNVRAMISERGQLADDLVSVGADHVMRHHAF